MRKVEVEGREVGLFASLFLVAGAPTRLGPPGSLF